MTGCCYHVAYALQSESALYCCLNFKELLARNRHNMRSLSNSNWIWTRNHLVCKRTLNHLPKLDNWLSCVVSMVIRMVHLTALHGKPYFLFPDALKRWSSPKNCSGIWSFLYYRERWYFPFPKTWSYTLDGKWKMIFLKKYTKIWYFLQVFWKDGLSNKCRAGTWSFWYYLKRWYFFPENIIFLSWAKCQRRSFSGNTWKHDALPSCEDKQET